MRDDDDVSDFIAAKSDQLNADDLVGGPIIVQITKVDITGGDEQPVTVHISGGWKPWKPCKTARRVLAALWGVRSSAWVGKWVRLFREPTVTWAGNEVGGIRISGASHIDCAKNFNLTKAKGKKAPQRVDIITPPQPKQAEKPAAVAGPDLDTLRDDFIAMLSEQFDAAPSSFRQFMAKVKNKPMPEMNALTVDQLRWSMRALGNGLGAEFREFLAVDPTPTPTDDPFGALDDLPA